MGHYLNLTASGYKLKKLEDERFWSSIFCFLLEKANL